MQGFSLLLFFPTLLLQWGVCVRAQRFRQQCGLHKLRVMLRVYICVASTVESVQSGLKCRKKGMRNNVVDMHLWSRHVWTFCTW